MSTLAYAPWAILNWSGMIFAAIWAVTGIGIKKITPEQQEEFIENPQVAMNA